MDYKKPLMWAGGIIIVLFAINFLLPGVFAGYGTFHDVCEKTPYDKDCICPEDSRKISTTWAFGGIQTCEVLEDLILDPESPTFEQDAVDFAKEYLSRYCGSICTDLECGPIKAILNEETGEITTNEHGDRYMDAEWGVLGTGARTVNIECIYVTEWERTQIICGTNADCDEDLGYVCHDDEKICVSQRSGTVPWRMQFLVESPTEIPTVWEVYARSNGCFSPDGELRCAYESYCDYFIGRDGSADWCYSDLPLNVVPNDYAMSVYSLFSSVGSGYPMSVGQ